jgi:hypothetical protein
LLLFKIHCYFGILTNFFSKQSRKTKRTKRKVAT